MRLPLLSLLNIQNTYIVYNREEDSFSVVEQVTPKSFFLRLMEDVELGEDVQNKLIEKINKYQEILSSGTPRPSKDPNRNPDHTEKTPAQKLTERLAALK